MKDIYVYGDHYYSFGDKVFCCLLGMRYMALAGDERPMGEIVAYGYTKVGTYRRARRKLARQAKQPKRRVVAYWTEYGARVR